MSNQNNKEEKEAVFTVKGNGKKVKFRSNYWIDLIRNNPDTYGSVFVECEDDRDKLIREKDEEIKDLRKQISELENR